MGWLRDALDNFFGVEPEDDPIVGRTKGGPIRQSDIDDDYSNQDSEIPPDQRPGGSPNQDFS